MRMNPDRNAEIVVRVRIVGRTHDDGHAMVNSSEVSRSHYWNAVTMVVRQRKPKQLS